MSTNRIISNALRMARKRFEEGGEVEPAEEMGGLPLYSIAAHGSSSQGPIEGLSEHDTDLRGLVKSLDPMGIIGGGNRGTMKIPPPINPLALKHATSEGIGPAHGGAQPQADQSMAEGDMDLMYAPPRNREAEISEYYEKLREKEAQLAEMIRGATKRFSPANIKKSVSSKSKQAIAMMPMIDPSASALSMARDIHKKYGGRLYREDGGPAGNETVNPLLIGAQGATSEGEIQGLPGTQPGGPGDITGIVKRISPGGIMGGAQAPTKPSAPVVKRTLDTHGLYSKLDEAIQTLPNKFTPAQAAAHFEKNAVKPDELEWSGMKRYLDQINAGSLFKDVPITRDELAKMHAGDNPLKTKADILTNTYKHGQSQSPEWTPENIRQHPEAKRALNDMWADKIYDMDTEELTPYEYERHPDHSNPDTEGHRAWHITKYNPYTQEFEPIPEVGLFHNTDDANDKMNELNRQHKSYLRDQFINNLDPYELHAYMDDQYMLEDSDKTNAPKFENKWGTKGGSNYREILIKPDAGRSVPQSYLEDPYVYPHHWPEHENIIASVRAKDMQTPDGKKVTLADETQTDWGQTARKQGFKLPQEQIDELHRAVERAKADNSNSFRAVRDYKTNAYDNGKTEFDLDEDPKYQELNKHHEAMAKAYSDAIDAADKAANGVPRGPYIDNTSKWTDLAIKHSIYQAARDGSDYFAWPTGEGVADRYSMRSHLNNLSYKKIGNNWYLYGKQTNGQGFNKEVGDDELEANVGNELAAKIRNNEGKGPTILPHDPTQYPSMDEVNAAQAAYQKAEDEYYSGEYPEGIDPGQRQEIVNARREALDKARYANEDIRVKRANYLNPTDGVRDLHPDIAKVTLDDVNAAKKERADLYSKLVNAPSFRDKEGIRDQYNAAVKKHNGLEDAWGEKQSFENKKNQRTLEGDDFDVGGIGHKKFYNEMYPLRVQEVMRKAGHGKIQPSKIPLVTGGKNPVDHWAIPLSPETRAKILNEGFPRYARGGKVSPSVTKAMKFASDEDGIKEALRVARNAGGRLGYGDGGDIRVEPVGPLSVGMSAASGQGPIPGLPETNRGGPGDISGLIHNVDPMGIIGGGRTPRVVKDPVITGVEDGRREEGRGSLQTYSRGETGPEAGEFRDTGGLRRSSGVGEAPREGSASSEALIGLPTEVKIPLSGKVLKAGPNPVIRKAAQDYMQSSGLDYNPPKTYAKVDLERSKRIAQAYSEMPHAPNDPLVKAAYAQLAKETIAQYNAAKAAGTKFEFWDPNTEKDPYNDSPRLAVEDLKNNNHMFVYPTLAGFGSDEATKAELNDNPLLAMTKETWNGKPVTVNDMFRAIHDYYGHAKEGFGFRANGEENAWRSHAAMFSPLARLAMTSETRGQNSWLNYGPHGEKNRNARTEDTHFADQKTGVLPHWVQHEGAEDFVKPEDIQKMKDIYSQYRSPPALKRGGIVNKAMSLSQRKNVVSTALRQARG